MTSPSQSVDELPSHYSVGLGELLAIVWRRKFCLVFCMVASLALGGVYYLKAERVYEVKCRLLVEKQELPLAEFSQQQRSYRDLEFLGTQAEIVGSPAVMAMAVEQIQWPIPTMPGVSPVAMFKERVSVRPVMGTNVLSITLQADEAVRSTQAMNALVDSYRTYMQRAENDVHTEVLRTLTQGEKDVRTDLVQLEEQYRELRERSPLIATFKNGADVQLAHVDQLGRQLAETRARRVELESQLRVASIHGDPASGLAVDSGLGRFINASLTIAAKENAPNQASASAESTNAVELRPVMSPAFVGANLPGARDMVEIQNQLMRAKVLEKELYSRFGPRHPEVRAVSEQIASLAVEEQKALQAGHDLLRRELETVQAHERQLSELCQSELDQTKSLDNFHLQEQQMISQLTRLQGVHDSLVGQLRQWKLASQISSDGHSPIRIAVLEPPLTPVQPAWPAPRILLAICGAIGMVTGFSLIAFLEQRSRALGRNVTAPLAAPGI